MANVNLITNEELKAVQFALDTLMQGLNEVGYPEIADEGNEAKEIIDSLVSRPCVDTNNLPE